MKYTVDERLEIGRRIYESEITKYEASAEYDISVDTARDYMRLYRDTYHLEPKNQKQGFCKNFTAEAVKKYGLKDYQSMTKEELIRELAMSKINEARAKKGYQVEGDGANKRFIRIDSKNTK